MPSFDDARLDDPDALRAADPRLRAIASSGARVRVEAQAAEAAVAGLDRERPRAVIAVGAEARLLRAVLEPTCPVPFVAWPTHALPAWVGPLDIVVVLAPGERDGVLVATVREAVRRGARVIMVAQPGSPLADAATGRASTLIPATTGDPQAAAIAGLRAMQQLGLGPAIDAERAALAADLVAEECSPAKDIAQNPAKELAIALGDALPLVWGGSVLAARASRRVAEALRAASGQAALAGEAEDLVPIIAGTPARDPFADPDDAQGPRPVLLILDDDPDEEVALAGRRELEQAASASDVRVCVIRAASGEMVERYARLLAHGLYAAAYLAVGLAEDGA